MEIAMARQLKRPLLLCQWRAYEDINKIENFIHQLSSLEEKDSCTFLLALPFTFLNSLHDKSSNSNIFLGGLEMSSVAPNSFTSSFASDMLKKAGAQFVLIGLSDRRIYY